MPFKTSSSSDVVHKYSLQRLWNCPYDVRIKNRLIVPPACRKRRLKGVAAERASGVKLFSINVQTNTQNTILDRSGPRIKTAATSVIAQQGAGGNRATVGNSRKGGAKARKKRERKRRRMKEMKVGTLNIGDYDRKGQRSNGYDGEERTECPVCTRNQMERN